MTKNSEILDSWSVREFKEYLLDQTAAKLRNILRLEFASLDEVIALCQQQLKYSELSCEVLAKRLKNMPVEHKGRERWLDKMVTEICQRVMRSIYLQDCEQIAEYLHTNTAENDQQRIRNHYWQRFIGYVEKRTKAILIHRYGEREGEIRVPDTIGFVEDQIFKQESFGRLAAQYKPQKGKTFDKFIKQQILWRILGVPVSPGTNLIDLDISVLPQAQSNVICKQDASKIHQALNECLDRLKQHTNGRNADSGIEKLAVFELRYKGYRDPLEMRQETLKLVKRRSGHTIEELQEEYYSIGQTYKEREAKLQEAEYHRKETLADMLMCELELDISGYSTNQLDLLRDEALQRTLEDMQNELKALKRDVSSGGRLKELDYIISYSKYDKAVKRLEKVRADYEKEPKRSEVAIGNLIGITQAAVSRRLKSAKEFLKRCLKAKGIQGQHSE